MAHIFYLHVQNSLHGFLVSCWYAYVIAPIMGNFFSAFVYMVFCGLGITAGAHRLWSHKAYNAKWPLRMLLMIAQTAAHQNSIFDWVRDHR